MLVQERMEYNSFQDTPSALTMVTQLGSVTFTLNQRIIQIHPHVLLTSWHCLLLKSFEAEVEQYYFHGKTITT